MGKKGKDKKGQSRAKKGKVFWLAGPAVVLVIGWFAWGWISTKDSVRLSRGNVTTSGNYVRRETRTPLSPALFVGKTAEAYQVAQEIPDALDQIYCYCECDRHMGHRSLLSCFTDSHAAT